mmetsp:Transcript_47535/g.153633  ORF Transcript_47535/g.153633 Transcript_47535/m.153633 type:complete len:245 (+) Transcript_47535:165-899(+)
MVGARHGRGGPRHRRRTAPAPRGGCGAAAALAIQPGEWLRRAARLRRALPRWRPRERVRAARALATPAGGARAVWTAQPCVTAAAAVGGVRCSRHAARARRRRAAPSRAWFRDALLWRRRVRDGIAARLRGVLLVRRLAGGELRRRAGDAAWVEAGAPIRYDARRCLHAAAAAVYLLRRGPRCVARRRGAPRHAREPRAPLRRARRAKGPAVRRGGRRVGGAVGVPGRRARFIRSPGHRVSRAG